MLVYSPPSNPPALLMDTFLAQRTKTIVMVEPNTSANVILDQILSGVRDILHSLERVPELQAAMRKTLRWLHEDTPVSGPAVA